MKLTIFRRNIFTTYNHCYYELSLSSYNPVETKRLTCIAITDPDISEVHLSKALRKMLKEQPSYVTGYLFQDENSNIVGHVFLMRRGGTEVLYKIRHIDYYLFALRVFEEYRGNGYAGEILTTVIDMLAQKGAERFYLTVKKDNVPARKVYDRLGFKVIGKRFFVRVWKMNIPYYQL